jgi:hypothetical protein
MWLEVLFTSSTIWTAARSGENERLQALSPSTSIAVTSQKLSLFNITLLYYAPQATPATSVKAGTHAFDHTQSSTLPLFHSYGSKDEKYSRT